MAPPTVTVSTSGTTGGMKPRGSRKRVKVLKSVLAATSRTQRFKGARKSSGKNPKSSDPLRLMSSCLPVLPPVEFGTSFWWTVSAYKTTCLNRPLNRKNIKTGTPAQAYRPPISWMYQSVSNGARLPPQLIINTVPCQVSSMYDVTSTCLNMLAWTPSNTYHTSGRVKGDDTGKLCDVQAPVLLVVLLAKQFAMPFPQALQAHWNVDSQLNCIQLWSHHWLSTLSMDY